MYDLYRGNCTCEDSSAKICKNFIVFGGTGVGKSTFLDSLINFLMGVTIYHDWRYKLIDERERIAKMAKEHEIDGEDQEAIEAKA